MGLEDIALPYSIKCFKQYLKICAQGPVVHVLDFQAVKFAFTGIERPHLPQSRHAWSHGGDKFHAPYAKPNDIVLVQ